MAHSISLVVSTLTTCLQAEGIPRKEKKTHITTYLILKLYRFLITRDELKHMVDLGSYMISFKFQICVRLPELCTKGLNIILTHSIRFHSLLNLTRDTVN